MRTLGAGPAISADGVGEAVLAGHDDVAVGAVAQVRQPDVEEAGHRAPRTAPTADRTRAGCRRSVGRGHGYSVRCHGPSAYPRPMARQWDDVAGSQALQQLERGGAREERCPRRASKGEVKVPGRLLDRAMPAERAADGRRRRAPSQPIVALQVAGARQAAHRACRRSVSLCGYSAARATGSSSASRRPARPTSRSAAGEQELAGRRTRPRT